MKNQAIDSDNMGDMKLWVALGLILMFPGLLSCGKKESDAELVLVVKPDTSFILPGKHETSCYDSDIVGPRLYYPRFEIQWTGTGDFYPAAIKLKFNSALVTNFECQIDEDITQFLQDDTGAPVGDNFLASGKTYNLRTGCAIECGNIAYGTGAVDKAFKITGELKMIGYSLDAENTQKPHVTRATIFLQNLP